MDNERSQAIYDLLIVGAGPIGLATAVSAHRRGCKRIAVIDQTRAFGPAGDGVLVTQNMTRALRLLAPEVADKLCASPGYQKPFKLMDVDGTKLNVQDVEQDASPCGMPSEPPSIGAHWHGVQRELLNVLPSDVALCINTQFIGIADDPEDQSVVLVECVEGRLRTNPFAFWGNDPAAAAAAHGGEIYKHDDNCTLEEASEAKMLAFRARIVVGADGINSRMRAEVCRLIGGDEFASRARAKYWGYSSVKAIGNVPEYARAAADEVEERYLSDGSRMCVIGSRKERARTPNAPHVMLVRLRDETAKKYGFDWRIIVQSNLPEDIARRLPDAGGHGALVSLVQKRLRDAEFPHALVEFVTAMLREEEAGGFGDRKVIVRPTYIVQIAKLPNDRLPATCDSTLNGFEAPFGHGRIILAGDSLHGTPPFHAQGMAMGLEDVVELVDVLAKNLHWNENDTITEPDVDMLDTIRTQYRDARFERLKRVQRDTLKRLWSWDQKGFEELETWLLNFIPKADGWRQRSAVVA